MEYVEDVLKNGFEQTTILQPDDYEGKVTATLIRKRGSSRATKAILCIHGFNDYFFQAVIADEFLKKGYHFYALDLRKYGRSILQNHRSNNVRSLWEYYEDIDRALEIIKEEGSQETVLYGHSTGGLIITLYASDRKEKALFDVLVCNSPFYDFNLSWIQKKTIIPLLSFLGRLKPDVVLPVGFSKFYGKSLHKNDFGEWDYNLLWKPHVAPSINAGWVNAIDEGHLKIAKGISVNTPILILHALISVYPLKWSEEMFRGDAILNIDDIIEKSKFIDSPSKDVIGFDNAIHDLVLSRKPAQDLVFKTIFEWLDIFFEDKSRVNLKQKAATL
ncbi:alpha/beta hydrolase [Flavobacterium granuli]|uniref:Alpha-beta hydrolase superfamily lysophospholipase n=1 Tax=Flavobacterium granuli TaxID=280093 RepID=A0ABU1S3Y9_9FLAO|nr:alpha/beta hydrolase [Flavobacterium granuli]MDR6845754.1 alpha-beta hydrolase superfamily lysophospholipase [Flavobacterium granuli]